MKNGVGPLGSHSEERDSWTANHPSVVVKLSGSTETRAFFVHNNLSVAPAITKVPFLLKLTARVPVRIVGVLGVRRVVRILRDKSEEYTTNKDPPRYSPPRYSLLMGLPESEASARITFPKTSAAKLPVKGLTELPIRPGILPQSCPPIKKAPVSARYRANIVLGSPAVLKKLE